MDPSSIGPYQVLSKLGEGGMGTVYRARDTQLGRDVAVKVLLPAVAGDPDRLAWFGREAQVLASLNHPNVAAIYGLESTGDTKALILELVEGPTLADVIRKGPIPIAAALTIARQIADGLDAAHERGIVHRDLKPANIKVRPDGTVKILDFGLAKATEAQSGPAVSATMSPTMSIHATMTGMILGTAAYMSPEQASGQSVDKRADIWAFGVTLWEMLTGRQMFEGETISHVLAGVLTREPDLTAVPDRVRPLLARCLEKDPKKRLRDIGDAMSLVKDPTPIASTETSSRRWPLVVAWTVAGMLAVALAVLLGSRGATRSDGVADSPPIRFQIPRPLVSSTNNAALAFAISPDGRLLAYYTLAADGRPTLSVRTLATGEDRQIPGSSIQGPLPPIWSPDSRQLAYATTVSAYVFDVATASSRELCACRFNGGAWNRQGVMLLGAQTWNAGGLRRVSLDNRMPVLVTTPDSANDERDTAPIFLADGRRFLFTRSRRGAGLVTYLGSLEGGEPKRIADGSRSLFTTPNGGSGSYLVGIETAGLVAQPFDTGTMTTTGELRVVVPGAEAMSFSNDGILVTSTAGSLPTTIPTWFDRKGTALGTFGASSRIQSVSLSPDSRVLAVADGLGRGAGTQFWLRSVAGTTSRVPLDATQNHGVWSPNGTRLVISSGTTLVNLYERAADGTGSSTRLVASDRDTHVNDWSHDGRWLIYTMPKSGPTGRLDLDLWVIPMTGSGERTPVAYLSTPAREAQAEFSPDGRFVAYTSTQSGDPEVYVQPFPTASDGKWLISPGGGSEPHWSRDGKELFYFAGQTLMSVPVKLQPTFSNGSPVRLFDAPVQPWYVNDSDRSQVSADGRFLLLVPAGTNTAPPLDVIVNWPALLRR